jgi:hypothetical protein
MTHIVQQRSGPNSRALFIVDRISILKLGENARHQVHRAEAMREARVLGSLICVEPEPKLFDAAESLKFRRVDQLNYQLIFGSIVAQLDDVVNRIAVDTLRQFRWTC